MDAKLLTTGSIVKLEDFDTVFPSAFQFHRIHCVIKDGWYGFIQPCKEGWQIICPCILKYASSFCDWGLGVCSAQVDVGIGVEKHLLYENGTISFSESPFALLKKRLKERFERKAA